MEEQSPDKPFVPPDLKEQSLPLEQQFQIARDYALVEKMSKEQLLQFTYLLMVSSLRQKNIHAELLKKQWGLD